MTSLNLFTGTAGVSPALSAVRRDITYSKKLFALIAGDTSAVPVKGVG
ncbi:MAG: hypothetical protein ACREBG_27480 [Pyrinomonadaceae bacterium]